MVASVKDIPDYDSLAEVIDDSDRPWLDRQEVDEAALDDDCRTWRERGVLILPGLLPEPMVDRYTARFEQYRCLRGFQTPTPYEHIPEIARHVVVQSQNDHVDAVEIRHRADVLNLQRVQIA